MGYWQGERLMPEARCGRCSFMIPYEVGFEGKLICPHCHVDDPPVDAMHPDNWDSAVSGDKTIEAESDFVKHDDVKIRMDLIPPSFLTSTATVLTYGSIKYTDNNWMKCPKWSRYYGALLRHLMAILGGEEVDPESGLPHLWHLNCNAAFLTEFQEVGIGEDDMPKRTYRDRSIMIQEAFKTAKELHDGSA